MWSILYVCVEAADYAYQLQNNAVITELKISKNIYSTIPNEVKSHVCKMVSED